MYKCAWEDPLSWCVFWLLDLIINNIPERKTLQLFSYSSVAPIRISIIQECCSTMGMPSEQWKAVALTSTCFNSPLDQVHRSIHPIAPGCGEAIDKLSFLPDRRLKRTPVSLHTQNNYNLRLELISKARTQTTSDKGLTTLERLLNFQLLLTAHHWTVKPIFLSQFCRLKAIYLHVAYDYLSHKKKNQTLSWNTFFLSCTTLPCLVICNFLFKVPTFRSKSLQRKSDPWRYIDLTH